jgi:hypothetical protein
MKSTPRTPIAALALIVPLAGALVAQPAAAASHAVVAPAVVTRAVVAQPAIHAIVLDSSAGLAPGAVLRVQVQATPGARNPAVTLGTSGVRVALREQGPGRYVGTYTVRRGDRIDPHQRLTARASFGSRSIAQAFDYPTPFQALAMGAGRGDERAPTVSQLTPSNGARLGEPGRTAIHARLADQGSGVDPRSVRLTVDGLDVTRDARIDQDQVAYVERLGRGTHQAVLVVRDRSGNASRTAWSFRVI